LIISLRAGHKEEPLYRMRNRRGETRVTAPNVSLSVGLREKEKKEEKTFVFRRLYFEKKKTQKKEDVFEKNYMNI
jgi:hypothetical protein